MAPKMSNSELHDQKLFSRVINTFCSVHTAVDFENYNNYQSVIFKSADFIENRCVVQAPQVLFWKQISTKFSLSEHLEQFFKIRIIIISNLKFVW